MSSTVVVAWMVSSGVPPLFLRESRIRPIVVPPSRAADTPAAPATVIAPVWVRSSRVPRVASVTWMPRLAARSCASPPRCPRGDVAVGVGDAGGGGLVEGDGGLRAVEGDLAEWAGGGELRAGRLRLHR
jgi:hypothetical protein